MRFIIFSDNSPVHLHAVLESAGKCLPHTQPEVLLTTPIEGEIWSAYQLVSQRFRVECLAVDGAGWRNGLLSMLARTRVDGTLEQMALFGCDNLYFSRRIKLNDAWPALSNRTIRGVSLVVPAPHRAWTNHFGKSALPMWDATGPCFSLGTVYRTSDVMGPFSRHLYDSSDSLLEELSDDATMCRKQRMTCLPEPAMVRRDLDLGHNAAHRYLDGEVLDLGAVLTGTTQWTQYKEDE